MTEQKLNIYQKLAKIRKQVEVMKRDTKAYNFSYTKEESILAKLTVFMDKYNLSLIPEIVPESMVVEPYRYEKTKTTKTGEFYEEHVNEVLVFADTTWTWVNNEDPDERIVVPWAMVGQQSDASQSFGSGLTYSSRYFLLKFFNISTSNDDPDKFRGKQKEAEMQEDKIIAEKIIQMVDAHLKAYLTTYPEQKEVVQKAVSQYVKGGNYFAITQSTLAGKLLQDIQKQFQIQEEK